MTPASPQPIAADAVGTSSHIISPQTVSAATSDHELLTLPEVAARLRVPVNTLRWWRQQGTGPVFFKLGRRLVTTTGDLRDWIEEQRNGHGPHAA